MFGSERRWALGEWWRTPLLGLICCLSAGRLYAQATAPVPLDDRSYEVLDRLLAQLPSDGLVHGQRPYTRAQIARYTVELREALDALAAQAPPPSAGRLEYLDELLSALEDRYRSEITQSPGAVGDTSPGLGASIDVLRAQAGAADSPFRGLTWNGLGAADNALVNPLLDYDYGRPLSDGATGALELEGRVRAGSRVVVFGGPRVALQAPRGDGDPETSLSLRTAALRLKAGRWAFQVGRGAVRRGQGRRSAVLFSDNSPPLDMAFFENEEPVRLPWLFSRLGPLRFSALFADLGPEQNFPHAKLYSNWLTFRPAPRLELGGGFIVQDGGQGAPEQSIWRRVGDYLIFVDVVFQKGTDFQASNKIAALDFRWWVPGDAALLYGEMAIDDFRVFNWNHVREMLWPDAAHLAGVVLPRLDGEGRLSGWVELQHTGIRMYRHYDFSSGVTRGRFLLGSGLGSDAHSAGAGLDFAPSAHSTVGLEVAVEVLSHDEWTAPTDPYFHFEKVADRPEERRTRAMLVWEHRPLSGGFGWQLRAGAERARNFGFERGERRDNAALQIAVEWSPKPAAPGAP